MEETGFNLVSNITEAGEALGAGINVVWDLMTGNPWLALLIGVNVIGWGFAFFHKAKRAAK